MIGSLSHIFQSPSFSLEWMPLGGGMKNNAIFIFLSFAQFLNPSFAKGDLQKNIINVLHYNVKRIGLQENQRKRPKFREALIF